MSSRKLSNDEDGKSGLNQWVMMLICIGWIVTGNVVTRRLEQQPTVSYGIAFALWLLVPAIVRWVTRGKASALLWIVWVACGALLVVLATRSAFVGEWTETWAWILFGGYCGVIVLAVVHDTASAYLCRRSINWSFRETCVCTFILGCVWALMTPVNATARQSLIFMLVGLSAACCAIAAMVSHAVCHRWRIVKELERH